MPSTSIWSLCLSKNLSNTPFKGKLDTVDTKMICKTTMKGGFFCFSCVRQETFLDPWNNGPDTTIFAGLGKLPHFSSRQRHPDTPRILPRKVLIFNSCAVPIGNTPGHKQPNKHSTRTNIVRHTFQAFITFEKPDSKGHPSYSQNYCKNFWLSKSSAVKMKRQVDRSRRRAIKLGVDMQV